MKRIKSLPNCGKFLTCLFPIPLRAKFLPRSDVKTEKVPYIAYKPKFLKAKQTSDLGVRRKKIFKQKQKRRILMKKFKKIIPALCMLLVSAVLLGSSTYAWFSLNNKVTVTGMQVSTKVDNNLLIADSTEGTVKAAENAFGNALNQSVNGELQPASTVDGVNFFYTNEAKANGEAIKKSYSAVSDNKITIGSKDYQAYAQQVFELKAINTSARDVYVKLSTLNLLYNGSAVTVEQAYRVAVFCQDLADGGNAYKAFGTAANSIFTIDGATNFTTGEAVNSTTTTAAVTYGTKFFKSVSANSTAYYKITVRMWL
ncbi:MAG: hypothetical protein MRZ91_03285, partial [Christensenellaceae bacterium]|nr:hypothetical protein [Christensenellaceae bacterium]